MSPLVAAPNRGYSDWQRVSNYDSGVLWNNPNTTQNTEIDSPIFDVSRYARLAGRCVESQSQCFLFIKWYADSGGSVLVGQRIITLDANITNGLTFFIPNQGPFCKVEVHPIAGQFYTFLANIFGTNREPITELTPPLYTLIDAPAAPITGGAQTTFYPNGYWSGPVQWWLFPGIAGVILQIEYLNTGGVWNNVDRLALGAANTDFRGTSLLPAAACRVQLFNSGAASTCYVELVAAADGAT